MFQTVASNAGLLEMLGKPGHFTLFAPTNDAFSKLDREVMDRLMANKGALKGKLVIRFQSAFTSLEAYSQTKLREQKTKWF